MTDRREVWVWVGGAALIVVGVALWLVFSTPEPILPSTYNFGYR